MDFDQIVDTVVQKAERITPFRGVVAVAWQLDRKIKIICMPINSDQEFMNEGQIRKNRANFNPDSLETEFFVFAINDAVDCLKQMSKEADSQISEDTDDEDLALGGPVSGAYSLDSGSAASIMVNPYSRDMQVNLVRKMRS
ncbi:MAG: hypothetical protein UR96_C0028G0012 [candidate division WS6 bacterium GW2011_GWC1_36_11]|uniref:Uncharacterized protein n=1 Tax=candidate division WS6 bacterium GW2011_GWC1_36_11 TaxID=1619090 RepID=A0A0G0GJE3_9BACT|nr:MAG: hypothetical protein UR96_C0028G0012 [candidate division WS6 bacterium GW2011_GWC1_36_11]